MILLHFQLFCH